MTGAAGSVTGGMDDLKRGAVAGETNGLGVAGAVTDGTNGLGVVGAVTVETNDPGRRSS